MCWTKVAGEAAGEGELQRRFMNVVKEDMEMVGVTVDEAGDRVRWRKMIRCGDP